MNLSILESYVLTHLKGMYFSKAGVASLSAGYLALLGDKKLSLVEGQAFEEIQAFYDSLSDTASTCNRMTVYEYVTRLKHDLHRQHPLRSADVTSDWQLKNATMRVLATLDHVINCPDDK